MKNNRIIVGLFSLLLFATSCKKDKAIVDISKCKITSSTDDFYKKTYSYDSYGRITKLEYFDQFGASGGYRTYNYGFNILYVSYSNVTRIDTINLLPSGLYHYFNKGGSYDEFTYWNSNQQLDSMVLRFPNSGSTRILFTYKYDANGNLVEQNAFDMYKPWYKRVFIYANEKNTINYIPENMFWTGGWGPSSIEDLDFQFNQFYGKTVSTYLPSQMNFQQYDQNTGAPIGTGSVTTYSYTKDSDGKIIEVKSTPNTGNAYSTKLAYTCP